MSRPLARKLAHPRPYICAQCIHRQIALPTKPQRAYHPSPRSRQQQPTPQQKHNDFLTFLEERGYINQIAGDRNTLSRLLRTKKVGIYAGVDPTAPSLHLGHLLPIMVLFWASLHGHKAVSLVGAGTARVGDPSGRLTARAKTAESVQLNNAVEMFNQTFGLWKSAVAYARRRGWDGQEDAGLEGVRVLENAKWLDQLNVLEFLKVLGNGMRVGAMLGRDTVRNKMEKGDGMSFSEFTYPLLQAWDWWHMYSTMGVQIQVGGSDQYGNIVAGMDAVRYIAQTHHITGDQLQWLDSEGRLKSELAPIGLTVPLLTTSSGEKFGKSAGNAIWLDAKMTSPFDLYGFLLRSSDADVERYLKLFTFVPTDEIATVILEHNTDPGKRKAQHLLASEVLELVHGREEALKTQNEHERLRNPNIASIMTSTSDESENGSSRTASDPDRIYLPRSLVHNTPFARIMYHAGLVPSKSEGARLVANGGVYMASSNRTREGQEVTWTQIKAQKPEEMGEFLVDGILVLRIGKWKVRVIEVVDDAAFEEKGLDVPGWRELSEQQS